MHPTHEHGLSLHIGTIVIVYRTALTLRHPHRPALQVEDIFRAGSDTVIPAAQWPTAKDDLEMDLVQMLKDKASNVRIPRKLQRWHRRTEDVVVDSI